MYLLDKYGVDYILVSNNERARYEIDDDALGRLFPVVYEGDYGGIVIYSVRGV